MIGWVKKGKNFFWVWDLFISIFNLFKIISHRRFGVLIVIFNAIKIDFLLCGLFLINGLWIPSKTNFNL